MKIITPGTLPPDEFRGKCQKCGCVFECGAHEVSTEEVGSDGVFKFYRWFAACPTCSRRVNVVARETQASGQKEAVLIRRGEQ